jgi:putative protease
MAELIENEIKRHISSCVETGIDALIATDIGVILMAKNILRLDIPIYASTYLAPINYEIVNLFKDMGVKRVMLDRHLTIDEIAQIVQLSNGIETEAFVHGPGCSNINVNCYCCGSPIVLNPKYYKPGIKVETLCQADYEVYKIESGKKIKIADTPILDAFSWCSLCQLPDLVNTGVTGLKIVGRECDQEYQGKIAKIYRELVNLIERNQIEEFQERLESVKSSSYFSDACRQKRCYYSSFFHAPYKVPLS